MILNHTVKIQPSSRLTNTCPVFDALLSRTKCGHSNDILTYLTTLLLTFTLSIHPLVRRDVACNVSVWIVSGYVGDVARYVSTGWWNRERPGTLCSCVMDDELGLRIHLLLSRPIVGNASRWVGSRQSTSLCVIYYN